MVEMLADRDPVSTEDFLEALEGHDCVTDSDPTLSLSSPLIRSKKLGLVAIGGEQGSRVQIAAFLDALHWHRHELQGQGTLRFALGRGEYTEEVLPAVATLLAALKPEARFSVQVEINLEPVALTPPDFSDASGKRFPLLGQRESVAGSYVRTLAENRSSETLKECDPEQRLASRVLRGDLEVEIPGLGQLAPVVADMPFQFPTQWTVGGTARYVDALMRTDSTPVVLELKAISGGQGQYYRHAIGQAVLYRSFIRQAKPLHPWFQDHGLNPVDCKAAVIFLEIRGSEKRRSQLLDDVTWLGELFDVAVVPLRMNC